MDVRSFFGSANSVEKPLGVSVCVCVVLDYELVVVFGDFVRGE